MNNKLNIRYIPGDKIDKEKWDSCIRSSANGLIYGYSFYLDHMAANWDGLVLNDYEAVMPLPWKRKWGIHYLYQPYFCAQSGIFGNDISGELINLFLQSIPGHFRYIDICLNAGNQPENPVLPVYRRKNFILPLNTSFERISETYRDNTKRNIRKSLQAGHKPLYDLPVDRVISLAIKQLKYTAPVPEKDYENFGKLVRALREKKMAEINGITGADDRLLAAAVFLLDEKRAYYILVGNTPDGKDSGASHSLVNDFIRRKAEKLMLLDFEGSDIEGIAFFYTGFGAKEETYPCIRYNNLPWYVKWAKK